MKNLQNARILHDSCQKNYRNTRIFMIFAGKLTKYPNFTRFLPESSRILHNNCPKNIFPDDFVGGGVPSSAPPPGLLRLWDGHRACADRSLQTRSAEARYTDTICTYRVFGILAGSLRSLLSALPPLKKQEQPRVAVGTGNARYNNIGVADIYCDNVDMLTHHYA